MLEEAKPFFEGMQQEVLRLQRCKICNEVTFYPRHFCPNDFGELEYEEISPKGKILTYTVVERCAEPTLQDKLPYVAALILLDSNVQMFGRLIDIPLPLNEPLFDRTVEGDFELQGEEEIIVFMLK